MAYNQNYGTQYLPNYVPGANNQPQHAYGYQSDEYMRQPAVSPYPSAPTPTYAMPTAIQLQQTVPQQHQPQHQEPRVIIVQQPAQRHDDECCTCLRMICSCIDWLLTRICYAIVGLLIILLIIGLVVYFSKFYRNH